MKRRQRPSSSFPQGIHHQTTNMATFALRVLLLALATTAIIDASQADSASWEETTAAQAESSDEESADVNLIEALRQIDASKLKDIQITVDSKTLPALMQDVQRGKKIKMGFEVVDDDDNEFVQVRSRLSKGCSGRRMLGGGC